LLQQAFTNLVHQQAGGEAMAAELWAEIEDKYSGSKRCYHTMQHLENLFNQLSNYKSFIQDWDVLVFSICYHDIVYNVLKHDNEEKSAVFAGKRLASINFPAEKIEKCKAQIIATKNHTVSADNDTNLFTDADLSILGQHWDAYAEYYKQVRKEYAIYPDMVYNPGRQKVLQHFLQMERIFKTGPFFNRFEQQARENLGREIEELNN
jgi:predicted metal-dependent HD superfamily phosphohydrolase